MMIVPKIWRVCIQQLHQNYYYTSLSLKKLNKKSSKSIKNKYKIVVVDNFYKDKLKIIIFKDYYSKSNFYNKLIFRKEPKIHCI